jgi:hypothetical protein
MKYFALKDGQALYEGFSTLMGSPWFTRETVDRILVDQCISPKTWKTGDKENQYFVECPGDEFPVVIIGHKGLVHGDTELFTFMLNTWVFDEITEDDLSEKLATASLDANEKSFIEDCLPDDSSIYTGHPWYQAACLMLMRGSIVTLGGYDIATFTDLNATVEKVRGE